MSAATAFLSCWPIGKLPSIEWCFIASVKAWAADYRRDAKERWSKRHPGRKRQFERDYIKRARKCDPEKWRLRDKANYYANRNQKLAYKRLNIAKITARKKALRLANPEKYRAISKLRYKTNIQHRLKCCLSTRLKRFLKKSTESSRVLIGCSLSEFKLHLEKQFTKGMGWLNFGRGGWHMDHIIPCSKFNLTRTDQVRQCFHFTNIQPMWDIQNKIKQDKIGFEFGNTQPLLTI